MRQMRTLWGAQCRRNTEQTFGKECLWKWVESNVIYQGLGLSLTYTSFLYHDFGVTSSLLEYYIPVTEIKIEVI